MTHQEITPHFSAPETNPRFISPNNLSLINQKSSFFHLLKRTFDISIVFLALILISPLLFLIAILIKLDSSGPALFTQERVGAKRKSKQGEYVWEIKNFRIYKFRTMFHKADQSLHRKHIKAYVNGSLRSTEEGNAKFKIKGDSRITRMGRILRKTSLDELPQIINILIGEMSLVGPRPVPTYEVAEYEPWHFERFSALPGVTGLWQVNGRGRVTFDEMISMDIEYVRNQSFWQDIKLLILTIPAVITGIGAE
jgi:lipopolysaccharide/colanic/teichoic acid biosynthesis glycosyltransferase